MKVHLTLIAFALVTLPSLLQASWYVDTSIAAAHVGGASRAGPFATEQAAQDWINASEPIGAKVIPETGLSQTHPHPAPGRLERGPKTRPAHPAGVWVAGEAMEETAPAAGPFHRHYPHPRRAAQPRLELGLYRRPDRQRRQAAHPVDPR